MSDEVLSLDSPLSTAVTTVLYDETDSLVLSVLHTKERLRELALRRLHELRSDKASLQSDKLALQADKAALQLEKESAFKQVEELRALVAGVQLAQRETNNALEVSSSNETTSQLPQPTPQNAINNSPPIRRQLTKPALPEKFNGVDKSPSISNWLFAIRLYLRVTQTEKEDHVVMASTFFIGTALDWWQGIERTNGEDIYSMSWQDFEERCIRRFQATNDAQLAFQRLLRWRQVGSLTSYLSGFQSMVQQIPPSLLTEEGRIFVLIEGLNAELQKSVRLMQPATVDEAINVAQRVGSTVQPSNNFNSSFNRTPYRQPSTVNRSNSQFNRSTTGSRFAPLLIENMEEDSNLPVDSHRSLAIRRRSLTDYEFSFLNAEQKQLYRDNKCFHCKRTGHLKKDCKSRLLPTKE